MAIQSAQLQVLAIQQETFGSESRFAKTDACFVIVEDAAGGGARGGYRDAHFIEFWPVDVPQLERGEIVQSDVVVRLTIGSEFAAIGGDDTRAIAQFGCQLHRAA